ncbi:MAG: fibronectin type III domain-containing protein, partial [archaeon]|nr:fibronectin type III domain-containing protein [archaeon]
MGKKLIALFCVSLLILSTSVLALDAPTVSSPSHPDPNGWSKGNAVMEWDAVEDATGYYFVNDQNPETTPSIDDEFTDLTSTRFNIGRDGVYYFHVRAIGEASLGPVSHYKLQVDITRPQWDEREILSAAANSEGNIDIFWDEPVDEASGIDYYRIHRDRFFDFAFRSATKKYAPAYGTSYTDTNNMEENSTFFYLLVAIDKAGNQSSISNRATATTGAFCNLDISFNAELSEDKETLLVSITSDGNIYGATLVATLPGGTEHEFFSEMNNFSEYSGEFDLSTVNEGVVNFDFDARERLGDDCSQDVKFIYDVTDPTGELIYPELNETISEEVTVTVNAFDNGSYKSGISSVEFFVRTENWESLGEMIAGDGNV